LARRPYVVVANKMDVPEASDNALRLEESLQGEKIFRISAVTGEGVNDLVDKIYQLLQEHNQIEEIHTGEERVIRRFEEEVPFEINIVDGVFEVSGNRIEKLVAMTNLDNEDALLRFQRTINHMGLEDALRARGIKPGDTVRIRDLEFDYSE
jgi:GTP-binding protein